jgi:lantibiotic modifying enzyme
MGDLCKFTISPECTELKKYIELTPLYNTVGDVDIFLFRVLDTNVNDSIWEAAMQQMRLFFKWIKHTNSKFHFVFDVHNCESIPFARVKDLLRYTSKKKKLLASNLHSSVLITGNAVVNAALSVIINLSSTTRPLSILLANTGQHLNSEIELYTNGIPTQTWEKALAFFKENLQP